MDLKKIRIIFSDIDLTLLPATGKDLHPTARLICRLIKEGYTFVPCTGRGTANIPREIWDIPGIDHVITGNGALVVDRKTGAYARSARLSADLSREILAFLRSYEGGSAFCYRDGLHYMDNFRPRPFVPSGYSSMDAWIASVRPMDLEHFLENGEPFDKMGFFSFDDGVKKTVRAAFEKQPFYDRLFLSSSGPWNIEINRRDATKGAAARWLLDRLGFTPDQMLAAGDNLNDLSMLELAGVSIAPENALAPVRAAVTEVVPDCREDGVENFFRRLLS